MAGSQDFAPDPRNDSVLALLDGALVPMREAKVSLFDAGFGMGDGVWEGLRLHKGALLFLDAHLDRLWWGAGKLRIEIGLTREALKARLRELLAANSMEDGAHLRLMVTRGRKASINQDPRNALGTATIACTAEFKVPSGPGAGLSLHTASIRTSGPEMFDMRLNSHSRLNLITALLEAIEAGADEALMLDPHGNVASCNATNFFWTRGGTLYTSGDRYCFNGITRGNVIALCREGLMPLSQGDFDPAELAGAEEAFVTGTMGGVSPVRAIDGKALPQVDGPVTRRVRDAYTALKDADAAANPFV
ncbi:aminotransferase class IV [Novosphingobium sp. PC22D]|uniref:aminotransferase class IV n=1 Tax=Novosphingobium sp. PC22D TaxID=1962403 RepID=UPI000BF13E34|nr:aminotransferase class IV [Novosphingobium sp. PC22D]PEQ10697.1 aminotransferase class IV [Novosphingobium sp. PC22D]